MTDAEKRPRGRPVKNEVKPIPATAERIAQTIFHAADKKLPEPIKNLDDT
jgi:hypothetical protein